MNNRSPDAVNPEERIVDQTFAHWVRERTGSGVLATAAGAASLAEGMGHACAWLVDPHTGAGFDQDALDALRQHAWVGDGSQFTPFVLDSRQRFYLWRNWQHESKLAASILQRCAERSQPIAIEMIANDIQRLFAGTPALPSELQRAAVSAVPGSRFFVLTGGPGTGKTTTVLRMLLMLLRHAEACGLPAHPSIALAAPTGKAAQRLLQAVSQGKADLQASMTNDSDADMLDLLPLISHADARTLHRLLGYRPTDNAFARGTLNPLPEDIVVVDEASMIDLAMMRQLLDAVRPDAMLILLGDPNQLASVDAGSVLADIVASTSEHSSSSNTNESASPLRGQVVTLTHSWRAGSGLQRSIEALRQSPDSAWLNALLANRADGDLHVRRCIESRDVQNHVDAWIERHLSPLTALMSSAIDANEALLQLRRMQILCALRDGPFGAQGINAVMTRRLAVRFDIDVNRTWHHARPVIITRNDYARGLFNGDVGIALEGMDGLRVWFELADRDGNIGLRSFSPRTLPAHDTAWAITIHRSQGSEYQGVAIVLPPDDDNRILSRELLYTAVSRARSHAEIWCSDDSLKAATNRFVDRHGGLGARLRHRS
ncbi:exodeoxyribonuclease V subunit alpha [Rhodanobacter sp. L36]|uniref:exodeoxyribonuclease V subunit alpha n=1 Tax=Rhodanobacter sp. L36 TaxID=1747221 RepID=UPI00131CC220|nr:exodeoxyribonuclease V subunit alpha [Rhodanobacter sp. L36]